MAGGSWPARRRRLRRRGPARSARLVDQTVGVVDVCGNKTRLHGDDAGLGGGCEHERPALALPPLELRSREERIDEEFHARTWAVSGLCHACTSPAPLSGAHVLDTTICREPNPGLGIPSLDRGVGARFCVKSCASPAPAVVLACSLQGAETLRFVSGRASRDVVVSVAKARGWSTTEPMQVGCE
ncbi:hypothetical protein CDD83_2937 [Cordyceps sp. RAO-2017]|nr:hypothetical protein CDD83_2937 [Cordyceps sp. RAO-2017]